MFPARRLLEERERLLRHLVALAVLRADREQPDRGRRTLQDRLRVGVAHDGELDEPLGMAVHVGAGVKDDDRPPGLARRQDRRDRGTLHAGDAPEVQDRARRDRTGVAGGHERVRTPLLHEPHRHVDGAVLLLTDRVNGAFIHPGDVRGVDDLQRPSDLRLLRGLSELRGKLVELGLNRSELTDQQDLHVRQSDRRLDSTDNNLPGGVIATHRIKRNPRHDDKGILLRRNDLAALVSAALRARTMRTNGRAARGAGADLSENRLLERSDTLAFTTLGHPVLWTCHFSYSF